MQSQARILAFKEASNLIADNMDEDAREQRWRHVGAALCWAGGCRCEEAMRFEDDVLTRMAEYEARGLRITDLHGKPLDLARTLAEGVPPESIEREEE